jgi:hypothetical protein
MTYKFMTNISPSGTSFQFAMMKKKPDSFFSKPACFSCCITLFETPVLEFCDAIDALITERVTHPEDNKQINYLTNSEVRVGQTYLKRSGASLTICWNLCDSVFIGEICTLEGLVRLLRKDAKKFSID